MGRFLVVLYFYIIACFKNPLFDVYVGLGFAWLIVKHIINAKLDPEKRKTFKTVKILVSITYWIVFFVLIFVLIAFGHVKIRFM